MSGHDSLANTTTMVEISETSYQKNILKSIISMPKSCSSHIHTEKAKKSINTTTNEVEDDVYFIIKLFVDKLNTIFC